jgi:hypothetical protein
MKGITATQLITALAVGLIIIGVLAYLVINWTGEGSGQISKEACKAKLLSLCGQWMLCDYKDSCKPNEGIIAEFDADCGNHFSFDPPNEQMCRDLL